METTSDLGAIPGVQAYLARYPKFAAHRVERLSGGLGNFTYRIHLLGAIAGSNTLVLKYAPPYAAASGGRLPLDQKRQIVEVQALRLANQLSTSSTPAFVKVPTVHLFDEENHVIIMEDAGEGCRTLKEVLIEEGLPKAISQQVGEGLGKFISSVHAWNRPGNPDLDLNVFANNEVGKYITSLITYGQLESTLTGKDDLPALTNPLLGIPEAKMTTISKLVERLQKAIYAASASDPITHGDLWPGNLVLSLRRGTDGTIEGVEKLYVLDWEVSKNGLPGLDLGQLCAELYTLSEFYPARGESTRAITESFLGAYRKQMEGGRNIGLARLVMSHIGAHVVALTPRVSSWSGREKTREVVEKGVEMLILGEEGPELALKASIVEPLLCQ